MQNDLHSCSETTDRPIRLWRLLSSRGRRSTRKQLAVVMLPDGWCEFGFEVAMGCSPAGSTYPSVDVDRQAPDSYAWVESPKRQKR